MSGDGQSDSPGYSAKHLTYFVMLTDAMQEVGGSSPYMGRRPSSGQCSRLRTVLTIVNYC